MLHAEGPLLTVDVSTQTSEQTAIDTVLERFIGGRGVGTALAHERLPFDADPFGPENSLFFTTGPMQASTMSFTGRMNCTGISPQTDRLLSSNAGGFMSRNFAATGNAAVEITGQSDELLFVHVTDEGVEFEAVPELEGATVPEVTTYIDETHGLSSEHVACIGPAGERRVRFASIMTTESRAFGRGGLGAVLGAKNVKAITFDGDSAPDIEVPPIQMDVHRDAATSDHIMKRQGTTSVTDLANEVEALPTRYFSELSFEGVEGINGDAVEDRKYTRGTCSACAFACKLPTKDDERGVETEGPEYETVMSFGSNCAVDDIVDVMQSNELCDRYGMDTITCGNVVAAYLASEDEFGNVELIHDLVADIAHRDGVGDRLAEGIERFHEDLEVENWTVKGLDFAAHDGRTLHGQGLSYAVANRGADHMFSTMYAWEYPLVDADDALEPTGLEGKPAVVIEQENARALEDCGIVCRFSRSFMTPDRFEGLFDAEYESLLEIGLRVVTLERHFNSRRGFDRDDDSLPYDLPAFEDALDEYYDRRGWERDGTVTTSHATGMLADD
ncbi:aldehyde ferredoxin oxidoreductase family protein [Natronorubrum aibiense]|uniref:Aldehyde ferredoxin oxidoreductase n=1 Tax=Natronorubrum aibiense TaxID=348826 RepID=A0A5P9P9K2_9EURY|nr:aldehyde ferredoxin oxidoreductase C-terminal domain-containing protein [Natronorubrum aibiense]QFU84798.1 aldehyde ferredoxin oxidoreductase [Natronorubrum aibiense]